MKNPRNFPDVKPPRQTELIPTRASLLRRLKDWRDDSSWQEFFDLYWELIYGVARRSGLSDDEAQEVVQETLISVAKHMPAFAYDPALGSFKAWLLNMARWRIIGQFRKRPKVVNDSKTRTRTAAIDDIEDPKFTRLRRDLGSRMAREPGPCRPAKFKAQSPTLPYIQIWSPRPKRLAGPKSGGRF